MKATIAYLIKDNKIICELKTTLKSGRNVEFSSSYCEEFLNANREYNLINAKSAKISRAKKWRNQSLWFGKEINECEILIF